LVRLAKFFAISLEEGAKTIIHLASSPSVAGATGQYFLPRNTAFTASARRGDRFVAVRTERGIGWNEGIAADHARPRLSRWHPLTTSIF
jgi:hypothetical protein